MLHMLRKKFGIFLAIGLNIAVVVLEILSLTEAQGSGGRFFQFYGNDSAILAIVACATMAFFQICTLPKRKTDVPLWVKCFKYIATCCLVVNLLVALILFGPHDGYDRALFQTPYLYQRFLCPIFAFASFVLFEKKPKLPHHAIKLATAPTYAYGAVMILLNLFEVINGPYFFLRVHQQSVGYSILYALGILGGSGVVAWLVRKLNRLL